MCIQMVGNDCKKLQYSIVLRKQTSFGRKLSVQRQTKGKIHMSHVITFDMWESLNYENVKNKKKNIEMKLTYIMNNNILKHLLFLLILSSAYNLLYKNIITAFHRNNLAVKKVYICTVRYEKEIFKHTFLLYNIVNYIKQNL